MNIAAGRVLKSMLPFGLFAALLAGVVLSDWVLSPASTGWLRVIGLEIQAACRDAGTQWMVVVCLMSYFVTFRLLNRKQSNSTPYPGHLIRPAATYSPSGAEKARVRGRTEREKSFAILASFRGKMANPDFWLVGFVGLVLLRYAFAYETAARSLQPLVLLAGIVFGKGIAWWVAWQPSLKANESRHLTPSLSPVEAEKVSAPSAINHQLSTFNRTHAILSILVFLLAASALWQPEYGMDFQYRGQPRWTGAWDNPNLYGLLMGIGTVLAVGLFVQSRKAKGQWPGNANERHLTPALSPIAAEREGEGSTANAQRLTSKVRRILSRATRHTSLLLLLLAVGLCAYGLVKSYSRGAWVGTAVGIGFLICRCFNREPREQLEQKLSNPFSRIWRIPRFATRLRLNWRSALVVLASALVLSFWQFRHTENPLARRAFSIGNPNDFSWRNRVATWSGAVTMMKDRPWVGHGWGKAETVFREQYKPVHLEDTAAIQMNDYLMLGISCGLPALLGLLLYLWHGSRGVFCERTESLSSPVTCHPSLPTICLAGAIVGMVGFWFDGGLFKLATGAVFWVLVELSRGGSRGHEAHANGGRARHSVRAVGEAETAARHLTPALSPFEAEREGGAHGVPRPTIALRWLAGILAALAIAQTVLQLGTPRLAVGERTLSIARKFLVPPKAKQDFEFLAAEPIWSAKQLGTLLAHVELANYNRELVNWKLPDDIYRRYVLSPQIDPALDGEMNWRRPLWESFYPRIRKESSLEAAAETIVRHLGERITIRTGQASPDSIAAGWQRQGANQVVFEAVYIAALRSAGIPARRSPSGPAEFWNGVEWQPAPRPRVAVLSGDHRVPPNPRPPSSPADVKISPTHTNGGGKN